MEEKLVRCWNCHNVINLEACKECNHLPDQTKICPYCGKCLCENPDFSTLERVYEGTRDEPSGAWHVGELLHVYKITEA